MVVLLQRLPTKHSAHKPRFFKKPALPYLVLQVGLYRQKPGIHRAAGAGVNRERAKMLFRFAGSQRRELQLHRYVVCGCADDVTVGVIYLKCLMMFNFHCLVCCSLYQVNVYLILPMVSYYHYEDS